MEADEPCRYSYSFIASLEMRTLRLVWDGEKKKTGAFTADETSNRQRFCFDNRMADAVTVFKISVSTFSAKGMRKKAFEK